MAKFNLQYTLLLLILKALIYSTDIQLQFTIHFATINTRSSPEQVTKQHSFTIHFATINTISNSPYDFKIVQFTIHFATINTMDFRLVSADEGYLQYTLLLLIHSSDFPCSSTSFNLQYTLLLLIRLEM